MTRPRTNVNPVGAFELIEQAVHLLRTAPAATLATYAAGTLPFILGFIYFWGDMSRSAFAVPHLPGATLGITLLYLWMKFTHAIFAAQLRAQVAGLPAPALTFAHCRRIFCQQAAIQPAALFLLPPALILLIPFGWVYAFFQSITALGSTMDPPPSLRRLVSQASRQAALWPRQNHVALLILSCFAVLVFLNWTLAALMLPSLFRSFFGVESMFTISGWSLLNTSFFAAMLALTFACVAPIFKAVYVLRCFYGESIQSGEDLKAELRRIARSAAAVAAGLLLVLPAIGQSSPSEPVSDPPTAISNSPAPGQESAGPGATLSHNPSAPTAAELDHAIDQVLAQRKYAWRLPREKAPPREGGLLADWLGGLRDWLGELWDGLIDLLRKIFRIRARPVAPSTGYGWITTLHLMLYLLLAAVILGLVGLLYRAWRTRRRQQVVAAQPLAPALDVADENVGADQLPEDGWMRLASELLERGELRLALRALYFGSLAHLAAQDLVTLARFKSNRDYELELRRRAHSAPDLLSAFGENVCTLERAWYGMHPVDDRLVQRFRENFQRMRGDV